HHDAARTAHARWRGSDPRSGVPSGLRAVPDAEGHPGGGPVPSVARGLPRARPRRRDPRGPSTARRRQVMGHHAAIRHLFGLAAFIGLAGCAVNDPTQFYALGRTAPPSTTARSAESPTAANPRTGVPGSGAVSIGVGPVIMPGYLEHSQIVTRT